MDPGLIAICCTLGGGLGLKFLEDWLGRRKARRDGLGSIAISTAYEDRWKNPEYVAMVHKTRELETEALGEPYTACLCEGHDPAPIIAARKEIEVDHRLDAVRIPKDMYERAKPCLNSWCNIKTTRTSGYCHEHTNAGRLCDMDGCSFVCTGNNRYCYAHKNKIKAGDYNKGDKKELTHVVFTQSGPKHVSEDQLNKLAYKLRENERKIKAQREQYKKQMYKVESMLRDDIECYRCNSWGSPCNCDT